MPQLFKFVADIGNQSGLAKAFGNKTNTKFRVTSSFTISSQLKAYSALPGTVLLQQQTGDDSKVNLILKPDDLKDLKLPVKYIIYRGLEISDFVATTNISDPNTEVNTTGLEILVKMKEIQDDRASGDDIPVEALFGGELSPPNSKILDEFFYKDLALKSQLFSIESGIEIGNFGSGQIGIDIVLENPEYFPTVEMAKKTSFEIEVSDPSDAAKTKWEKDLVRHFVDPAAFYGLHHDIEGGIGYFESNTEKNAATIPEVYDKIISPFATKNHVYLDIRNENGYSLNYYGNYVGSGSNGDKEVKIGHSVANLYHESIYDSGWPVHVVGGIVASTTLLYNEIFLKLRINDNEKPLLAGDGTMLPSGFSPDSKQVMKFIDERSLLPSTINPEFTESIPIRVPNKLVAGTGIQISTIVKLNYIKQVRLNDGSDAFPQDSGLDHLFGPITAAIPWDSDDGVQWIGSKHHKYYDGLNQGFAVSFNQIPIDSIDPALHTITLNSEIDKELSQRVSILNTQTAPDNNGDYTVRSVNVSGGKTIITVDEVIPSIKKPGDELKFSSEIFVYLNRAENKLIARDQDLSSNNGFQPGEKIKLYGVYFSSKAARFEIDTLSVNSGDTHLAISPDLKSLGFGGIMETGIVSETDTTIGGTGDNDSIIFYAAPRYYFQNEGVQKTTFFNYRGATHNSNSFFNTLKLTIADFEVEKTTLHPTIHDDLAILSYPVDTKVKENLYFLAIKKSEFETLKTAADSQLSPYHLKMCKLISQGNRLRDADYEPYYKFHLVITGLDPSGNDKKTTDFVEVYSRDGLIFTSPEFARRGFSIPDTQLNTKLDNFLDINTHDSINLNHPLEKGEQDQINSWNTTATGRKLKELYLLDGSTTSGGVITLTGPLNTMPIDLRNELDALKLLHPDPSDPPLTDIQALIKHKGAELFTIAKQRIRESGAPYENKDGISYLVRLMMKLVILNHPVIVNSSGSRDDFIKLFEKHSRGLEGTAKADFTSYPSHYKRILITGFDPFSGGEDMDGHLTNSSGNIALALDGEILYDGTMPKGVIRSAIFPVRWQDFDDNIVEDFIEPFMDLPLNDPNRPHMIITFSYGVHYTHDIDHDFHLERFAANWRSGGNDNVHKDPKCTKPSNWKYPPRKLKTLTSGQTDLSFIEATLPYEKLDDGSGNISLPNTEVVINHGQLSFFSRLRLSTPNSNMLGNTGTFEWRVFGKPNGSVIEEEITSLIDLSNLPDHSHFQKFEHYISFDKNINCELTALPTISGSFIASDFDTPIIIKQRFKHRQQNIFGHYITVPSSEETRIILILDNEKLKYRTPTNLEYVKKPTWGNYKDPALEVSGTGGYHDIRVEARSGSGGNYMSNEIHYRVAYAREKRSSDIITGHVHTGFHIVDPNPIGATVADVRGDMLLDVKEMIEKFNDII